MTSQAVDSSARSALSNWVKLEPGRGFLGSLFPSISSVYSGEITKLTLRKRKISGIKRRGFQSRFLDFPTIGRVPLTAGQAI